MGSALRIKVELDGRPIATIGRSTFAYSELQPGSHTIISKTHAHDSVMKFTSVAGEQRFFQTWISYGGLGIIDEIDISAGKECVQNGELVEAVE